MTVGGGAEVTPEVLAKVNRFTLTPLTAEQVYVRKFIVAHSAIDRDGERFSPALLADFARTLPGKSFFCNEDGHPGSWSGQKGPGQGRMCDASVEQMSLDAFEAKSGERPQLAPGDTSVSVLMGTMYMLKMPMNEMMMANIDGGIHPFVSVGFNAAGPVRVESSGDVAGMFNEWRPPGEACEVSSVWLGAQPGAGAVKAPGGSHNPDEKPNKGADMEYKDLYENEKTLREDTEKKHVSLVAQNQNTETELKDLKAEIGDTSVKELKALASDGKAYRDSQVKEYVRIGRLVGKLPDDPDALKSKQAVIEGFPMDFLLDEITSLQAEATAKGLFTSQLGGGEDPDAGRKGADVDPAFAAMPFFS